MSDRRKHSARKSVGPGSPAPLQDSDDALICLPEESKQTRERQSHRGVDTAVALWRHLFDCFCRYDKLMSIDAC